MVHKNLMMIIVKNRNLVRVSGDDSNTGSWSLMMKINHVSWYLKSQKHIICASICGVIRPRWCWIPPKMNRTNTKRGGSIETHLIVGEGIMLLVVNSDIMYTCVHTMNLLDIDGWNVHMYISWTLWTYYVHFILWTLILWTYYELIVISWILIKTSEFNASYKDGEMCRSHGKRPEAGHFWAGEIDLHFVLHSLDFGWQLPGNLRFVEPGNLETFRIQRPGWRKTPIQQRHIELTLSPHRTVHRPRKLRGEFSPLLKALGWWFRKIKKPTTQTWPTWHGFRLIFEEKNHRISVSDAPRIGLFHGPGLRCETKSWGKPRWETNTVISLCKYSPLMYSYAWKSYLNIDVDITVLILVYKYYYTSHYCQYLDIFISNLSGLYLHGNVYKFQSWLE